MENKIKNLEKLIKNSDRIVFFGGAGVSTESGIPDFRSSDGLYNQIYKYPPEQILSKNFFYSHTDEFFHFYREKMNFLNFEPNITHNFLKKLEDMGKLSVIITQNIDGLHQKAGSKSVYELHGSIYTNHCINCRRSYKAETIFNSTGIPRCNCGGVIKPDVVLYGEPLDLLLLNRSAYQINNADLLIVAGTSLSVPPANTLVRHFKGKNFVIINKEETPFDHLASIIINDSLGNVLSQIEL